METLYGPLLAESDPRPDPLARLPRSALPIERLMARTAVLADGCWAWRGVRNSNGYGLFRIDGRSFPVHRAAYELLVGPIPSGLEIDHLCFRRDCVNPAHLEPVTHAENTRRGRHNQNHGKPACHRGHPFDEANTYTDARGNRACRRCQRDHKRRYRSAK